MYCLTPTDLAKDALLAAFGFLPSALAPALTPARVALFLGLLNMAVVIVFRIVELSRRERRDHDNAKLRARVAELESQQRRGA